MDVRAALQLKVEKRDTRNRKVTFSIAHQSLYGADFCRGSNIFRHMARDYAIFLESFGSYVKWYPETRVLRIPDYQIPIKLTVETVSAKVFKRIEEAVKGYNKYNAKIVIALINEKEKLKKPSPGPLGFQGPPAKHPAPAEAAEKEHQKLPVVNEGEIPVGQLLFGAKATRHSTSPLGEESVQALELEVVKQDKKKVQFRIKSQERYGERFNFERRVFRCDNGVILMSEEDRSPEWFPETSSFRVFGNQPTNPDDLKSNLFTVSINDWERIRHAVERFCWRSNMVRPTAQCMRMIHEPTGKLLTASDEIVEELQEMEKTRGPVRDTELESIVVMLQERRKTAMDNAMCRINENHSDSVAFFAWASAIISSLRRVSFYDKCIAELPKTEDDGCEIKM